MADRQEPRAEAYDVAVVGSGLGGLSVAAALAKLGKSVLVVEQHESPGGYASVFERDGYRFDPAIHYTAQGNDGELLDVLLRLLGVREQVELITSEMEHAVQLPGLRVQAPVGIEPFIEENARQFPREADGIRQFFQLCVDATRESQQAAQRLSLAELDRAVEQLPLLFTYRMATVADVIDQFLTDPKAKALCGALWPYMGPPPSAASFMVYAGLLYATIETGPIYCGGSFQKLADAFVAALENNGGQLVLDTRVERIVVADGKATGIVLAGGREIRASTVVSNADALQTFEQLIGLEHVPTPLARQLQRFKLSESAFVVFTATSMDVEAAGLPHEMLIHNHWDHEQTWADIQAGRPGGLWIASPTTFDPGLAPAGEHLVILSSLAKYDIGVPWADARERFTESMLGQIEVVLPGFREEMTFLETATPETFERYTLNTRGASYGWAATPNQSTGKRLKQRTPIEGLYLSGHWTEPGAGSFRAIFSGVTAATQIAGLAGLEDFGKALAGIPTSAMT